MTCFLIPREILWLHISKTRRAICLKFCIRNAFLGIMTHAKFHFNRLMLTFIFGIWASDPPPPPPPPPPPCRAWRTTEKAGPDMVNSKHVDLKSLQRHSWTLNTSVSTMTQCPQLHDAIIDQSLKSLCQSYLLFYLWFTSHLRNTYVLLDTITSGTCQANTVRMHRVRIEFATFWFENRVPRQLNISNANLEGVEFIKMVYFVSSYYHIPSYGWLLIREVNTSSLYSLYRY